MTDSEPRVEISWGAASIGSLASAQHGLSPLLPETWYLEVASPEPNGYYGVVSASRVGRALVVRVLYHHGGAMRQTVFHRVWRTSRWSLRQETDGLLLSTKWVELKMAHGRWEASVTLPGFRLEAALWQEPSALNSGGSHVLKPAWAQSALVQYEVPFAMWHASVRFSGKQGDRRDIGIGYVDHCKGHIVPHHSPIGGWIWGRTLIRQAPMIFAYILGQRGNPSVGWVARGNDAGQITGVYPAEFVVTQLGTAGLTGVPFPARFALRAGEDANVEIECAYGQAVEQRFWTDLYGCGLSLASLLRRLRPTGGHVKVKGPCRVITPAGTSEGECIYEVFAAP